MYKSNKAYLDPPGRGKFHGNLCLYTAKTPRDDTSSGCTLQAC